MLNQVETLPNPTTLSTDELVDVLIKANSAYRAGKPLISDLEYDQTYIAELKKRDPNHSFLNSVEPEPQISASNKRITHAEPMLSTNKAYTIEDLKSYIGQVEAAAAAIGIDAESIVYRLTPKLDGMAANDDGESVAKRGDGLHGENISYIFDMGVKIVGGRRGAGAGEIVIDKDYFTDKIEHQFDMSHPRSYIAGLIDSDEIKYHHMNALADGAILFYPFNELPSKTFTGGQGLIDGFDDLVPEMASLVPILTDGAVITVENKEIREKMGSTNHHHRWALAIKVAGETAHAKVLAVTPQTGRTGRIVPVLEIEPTHLSGAEIRRVTAHTAANLKDAGLGVGAVVEIIRSGEVIPKILGVVKQASEVFEITHCPSCGTKAVQDGKHMACPNTTGCGAQIENTIRHFFSTMGNADLFGPANIKKLVENGVNTLPAIFAVNLMELTCIGFSIKQAQNLLDEISRARVEPVEDWRFLAAFGIRHLGRGDSRKIMEKHSLEDLPNLSYADIVSIDGFADKTATSIIAEIKAMWPTIKALMDGCVTVKKSLNGRQPATTQSQAAKPKQSSARGIVGRRVVFTGKMTKSRSEMEEIAMQNGMYPLSKVEYGSILVTGERVGSVKMKAAQEKGAIIMTESAFWEAIG